MRLRPTSTGWVVIALAGALGAAGRALLYAELLAGAAALAMTVVVAFGWTLMARRPPDMVRRLDRDRVPSDRPATASVTVTNPGRRRWGRALVTDAIDGTPVPVVVPALGAGASATVAVHLPVLSRGRYRLGPLTVTTCDPLGLVETRRRAGGMATLWVHPGVHAISGDRAVSGRQAAGRVRARLPEGGELHRLDDYTPGDDTRLIHWLTSLRRGSLMIRHPAPEHHALVVVVLDTAATSYAGTDRDDQFEHAVRVAASVVLAVAERGGPTQFETTAGMRLTIDATARRRARLLDELAAVQPGSTGPALAVWTPPRMQGPVTRIAVTGEAGAAPGAVEAAVVDRLSRRADALTLLRVGEAGGMSSPRPRGGPAFDVIAAPTSEELVRAWSAGRAG